MRLVFSGPPGAGKGTQATYFSKLLDIPHLSTGELLRLSIKNKTSLGLLVENIVSRGELVPDQTIIEIISNHLLSIDLKKGFILDGFPRTVNQATSLDRILLDQSIFLNFVIDFSINEVNLIDRIIARAQEMASRGEIVRADDDPEVFKARIAHYYEKNKPLTVYYQAKKILRSVNAMKPVQEVSQDIEKILLS